MKSFSKRILSLFLACVIILSTAVVASAQSYYLLVDAKVSGRNEFGYYEVWEPQEIVIETGDILELELDVDEDYAEDIMWYVNGSYDYGSSVSCIFNSPGEYEIDVYWTEIVMGIIGNDPSYIYGVVDEIDRYDTVIVIVEGEDLEEPDDPEPENYEVIFDANGGEFYYGEEYIEDYAQYEIIRNEYVYYHVFPDEDDVSREGYYLLGWSDSPWADDPDYYGGDEYICDEDETYLEFYAVWEEEEEDEDISYIDDIILDIGEGSGYSGTVVEVPVFVTDGYECSAMNLILSCDVADAERIVAASWPFPTSGLLATIYFRIPSGTAPGTYTISGSISNVTVDGKTYYYPGTVLNGSLKVLDPNAKVKNGDCNGDGVINARDSQRLYEHIVGKNPFVKGSDEYKAADVNGDGIINARDSQRLYEHIVGKDPLD